MRRHVLLILLTALCICAAAQLGAQDENKWDNFKIDRSRGILRDAYDVVKKHYYDPNFHGVNLDARYHEVDEMIRGAGSLGRAFGMIAGFLDSLNDSHTFFRPPMRPFQLDYGYRMQMIGENCFVTRVRPGTDAEGKIHPGDEIIHFNTLNVSRQNFRKVEYYFNSLSPQGASVVDLIDASGKLNNLKVEAKMVQRKRVMDISRGADSDDLWRLLRQEENWDHLVRQRWVENDAVMAWKMPEFDMTDGEVDRIFGNAHKNKTLILDLRGNGGGAASTLSRMVGNVMDHDVKIADRVGRKEMKPQLAKTRGGHAFSGKLIVLIDSESGSASELFARVLQLEHRGTVIGDRSTGAVMEARHYPYDQGADTKFFYSFSVTDADLIMADGKSLEHSGVVPDERVLPMGQDLANGSDPALARAFELAGAAITPAEAGKLFPFEWQPF